MGEIEGYLNSHTKADTVYYAEQHGVKLGAKDKKLDAAGKERLKQLQKEGASFSLPKSDQEYMDAVERGDNENPVDKSTFNDENGVISNSSTGDQNDNRGIRKGAAKIAVHAGVDGGANTRSVKDAQKNKEWRSLDKEDRNRIKRLVNTHINKSPNSGEIFSLLCAYVGRTEDDISTYMYRKAVEMLAERFYADAVTLHPVIVENNWSVLGGNISELIREVKKVVDHVAYKLPVGEDTSPRALLANAFEELAKTDAEKESIRKYRERVVQFQELETKLKDLRAQIRELYTADGKLDTKKTRELQFEANATANRIETLDRMLLRTESTQQFQNVLKREQDKARAREIKKAKDAVIAFRHDASAEIRETNPAAGKNDSETSNGIFFNTNDHDIGFGGGIQMEVSVFIGLTQQYDKLVFVEITLSLRDQSADWSWQSPR